MMSFISRSVKKATINYDTDNNVSSITIKDKALFPNGFKLNVRLNSMHHEAIQEALEVPCDSTKWERASSQAFVNFSKVQNPQGRVFVGVDKEGTPLALDLLSKDPKVVNIKRDHHRTLSGFFKDQLLSSDDPTVVIEVDLTQGYMKLTDKKNPNDKYEINDLDKLAELPKEDFDYFVSSLKASIQSTSDPVVVFVEASHAKELINRLGERNHMMLVQLSYGLSESLVDQGIRVVTNTYGKFLRDQDVDFQHDPYAGSPGHYFMQWNDCDKDRMKVVVPSESIKSPAVVTL